MYRWQPVDIHRADEAVLGCPVGRLKDYLFSSPAAALDHWSKRQPDATCLVVGGYSYSFLDIKTLSCEFSEMLANQGVVPGERVILELENSLGLVVAFLALNRLAAAAVILSPRLSQAERQKISRHALPVGRVHHSDASLPLADQRCCSGSLAELGLVFSAADEGRADDPLVCPSEVSVILYTTGTTGQPKGVMLTNQNLMFNGSVSGKLRGLQPCDRVLTALPLSHAFGLSAVLCSALVQGSALELKARFNAKEILRDLAVNEVIGFFGVPAMYVALVAEQTTAPQVFPKLRFLYSGGAPLDMAIKDDVQKSFGLPLHNGYGMTETGPTISQTRLYAPMQDSSVGFVIPGVDFRLIESPDLEPGVGTLEVSGPNIMAGYFREPEKTREVLNAGWLTTGDLARINDCGALEIVGRRKELIIKNGFNVYPPEIEAALTAIPGIALAAVIGKHRLGTELIVAFVETHPVDFDLDLREVNEQLGATLSGYKLLDELHVLPQLPASPSGKVLKHRL